MKKFCVITTGRAGSTSFMQALAQHDDVAVPNKQVDCPDHEIIKLKKPDRYWSDYAALAGLPVTDELSLVDAFYASNAGAAYAGFKTMPNRHRHLKKMLETHAPQVICIYRRDVASTIASFIVALRQGSWRRAGEPQAHRFLFDEMYQQQTDAHLVYLVRSMNLITRMSGAIKLAFEDLCDPAFSHPALERFFERPVRLLAPQPPVDGSSYVENWPVLVDYVQQRLRQMQASAAQQ